MSSTLKYISCPVSQLDLLEPIGVQTQVDSFKDIEYLPTSAIQDGVPITFEIGKDERFTDLSELVIKKCGRNSRGKWNRSDWKAIY